MDNRNNDRERERDIISNEVRSRLNPMSNPDTREHTMEYLNKETYHTKDEDHSSVKYGSVHNPSPVKSVHINANAESGENLTNFSQSQYQLINQQ